MVVGSVASLLVSDDELVAGALGSPFVAVEPSLPVLLSVLFVVVVVVVVLLVPDSDDGFFFTTVDCAKMIPTESIKMQITDNIFLIFLYVDS